MVKVRELGTLSSPCFHFGPLLESEPSLPIAEPIMFISIKNHIICVVDNSDVILFLISQFITLTTVLKSHIMMLDLWISTNSYLFVYLCQNSY